MSMNTKGLQTRSEILEGIGAGMSAADISAMTGINASKVYEHINKLIADGSIKRLGRGEYEILTPAAMSSNGNGHHAPEPPPTNGHTNGNSRSGGIPESDRRRVSMPEFMRSRRPITMYVEHSPTEVENVMRIELHMGGVWLPLPVTVDLRICVGDDVPRWSATQETYNGVTAFRVTYSNGDQCDYPHNPKVPLTVDVK